VAEAAFGLQLRRSRQAAALSLRQLAARVGYDHSYLSQVERGQRPGSAHLAQLCDRELGTGSALTSTYELARPAVPPSVRPPVPALAGVDVDVLEAVRHGVSGSFGQVREAEEWRAVVAGHAADFSTTPAAELLPELAADLQLLRASAGAGSTELAVPAAELAVMIALSLTALGRVRAAARWWRTARATADSCTDGWVGGRVRSWEAVSGLSEQRPLPELLALAEEAFTLVAQSRDIGRALAARAKVLALLDLETEARHALRDLLACCEEIPLRERGTTSLFGWSQYEAHGVESFVYTALGDTPAAYVAQDRALTLCPGEQLRERAELELQLAQCLVLDGEVAAGLATAMRVLVELEDQWHTQPLYDAAGRVLSAVQGRELGRPAVRDYRELLKRRPYSGRTVGSGSSSAWPQG
jgi:hypothetical protein